ncbi:MAG: SET domain-containing protein-lysine N-methyltransferase [Thermoplasmata archaeon]
MEEKSNINLAPSDEYMTVVYKHPAMTICEENNFKYVKVTEDIKFGELLLVEHVYASESHICYMIVRYNEYIFDQYHPRKIKFKDIANMDEKDISIMVNDKISHNCFGYGEKCKLLTDTITKLNHSCNQNCAVYINVSYKIEGTNIVFMELYAIQNIKKDSEITISYGPETSHKRDFVCNCGKSLNQRRKHFNIVSRLVSSLSRNINNKVRLKIYNYIQSTKARRVMMNHYLANNGIIVNNNKIVAYTENGMKMINKLFYKIMGMKMDQENVDSSNNIINLIKTTTFMSILETYFLSNGDVENLNSDNNLTCSQKT